ncbi:Imm1 family immunity protein [Streptomyces erythrochromogenes]|uniref:Imm1 family immunity protein n=1 Tax=Streptomyces erythrochromogenes TaxID=285574 RepID=UPI0036CB3955
MRRDGGGRRRRARQGKDDKGTQSLGTRAAPSHRRTFREAVRGALRGGVRRSWPRTPGPGEGVTVRAAVHAPHHGVAGVCHTSGPSRRPGRRLTGARATVALPNGAGDPGEHLVDPRAEGTSDGCADRDTVPLDVAARAVGHFIEHGTRPADMTVQDDRGE